MASADEALVDRLDLIRHRGVCEATQAEFSARVPEPPASIRIAGQPFNRRGQSVDVVERYQLARFPGEDHFGRSVNGETGDRHLHEQRLNRHTRQAFPLRCVREKIHPRQQTRHLIRRDQPRQVNAIRQSTVAQHCLVLGPLIAVADPHEAQAFVRLGGTFHGRDQLLIAFVAKQSRDRTDHDVLRSDAPFGAHGRPVVTRRVEGVRFHAGVNRDEPRPFGQARRNGLIGHRVGHGDERIRRPRASSLHPTIRTPHVPRLCAIEAHPVNRVHDGRHIRPARGHAPKHARLARMRVHHGRAKFGEPAFQRTQAKYVLSDPNSADQRVHAFDGVSAPLGPPPERSFTPRLRPDHENDLMPLPVQAFAGQQRVFLRTADDQASDYVADAHERAPSAAVPSSKASLSSSAGSSSSAARRSAGMS